MKKMLALFICLFVILNATLYSFAQDEQPVTTSTDVTNTDVTTTIDWVKQLQGNPLVKDVWVPVLPEYCTIHSLNITPNGTYSFKIWNELYHIGFRVSIINGNPITAPKDEVSPYQMYLVNNNIPLGTVTEELAGQVAAKKGMRIAQYIDKERKEHYEQYIYLDAMYTGDYQGYKAASFAWSRQVKSGNYVDPNSGGVVYETVLALTPSTMASVMCEHGAYEGNITTENLMDRLERQTKLGLSLTTYGDVDGNTQVNAKDALSILKHAVQKQRITDELSQLLADCNLDHAIDAKDALYTLRKAVFK